jgi:hypothetical protein
MATLIGQDDGTGFGVKGTSQAGEGVRGESASDTFAGVAGINNGPSVQNKNPAGVFGKSINGEGVHGETNSPTFAAVAGISFSSAGNSAGVFGKSTTGEGVHGETNSPTFSAVAGLSNAGTGNSAGVFGRSTAFEGVHGETDSLTFAAVAGISRNPNGTGPGVFGKSEGKGPAGFFEGNAVVTGVLTVDGDVILRNADCAEEFEMAVPEPAEPGSVMVLTNAGTLRISYRAYDKRVAGVVSGASNYKPGIILDKQNSQNTRQAIALLGKVYCKVDAQFAPVNVGDLLTTSDTPGHAMKATDQHRAFGAVIGKALGNLEGAADLLPILVALQ